MRKIPEKVRDKVFRQWLMGDSYERIARDNDVSKSTVNTIKEEFKKRWPDIEDLRKLSTSMRKANISFYDTARGAKLIEKLNIVGVSLGKLNYYIKLVEKMLSGKEMEREEIVESAIKLVALEEATGKEYAELVEDFETKSSEIIELEAKKESLERRIIELEERLKGGIEDLKRVRTEIENTVATEKRIKDLGLAKLGTLTKFIADYEILGFSAEAVQKLAALRENLLRLNIDPEKLEDYLKEKGSLDAQISELRRDAGDLNVKNVRLEMDRKLLLSKNAPLSTLDLILSTRRVYLPCKICGTPLPVPVENQEKFKDLIEKGLVLPIFCPRCGFQQPFTPMEIITQIGWTLLPKDDGSSQ